MNEEQIGYEGVFSTTQAERERNLASVGIVNREGARKAGLRNRRPARGLAVPSGKKRKRSRR